MKIFAAPSTSQDGTLRFTSEFSDNYIDFTIPKLSVDNGYEVFTRNGIDSYSSVILGRQFIFSPSTSDRVVGSVHSECKELILPSGYNFYASSQWDYAYNNATVSSGQNIWSASEIINSDGELVFENSHNVYTRGRTKLFVMNYNSNSPLQQFSNAANKSYIGAQYTYDFTCSVNGGFTLGICGDSFSSEFYTAHTKRPGIWLTFDESGNVGLTLGVNYEGHSRSETVKYFASNVNEFNGHSAINYGSETNKIKFVMGRKDQSIFEFSLYVNDTKVDFTVDQSKETYTPQDLAIYRSLRYVNNGNFYIAQDTTYRYEWGTYFTVSPASGKHLVLKNLDMSNTSYE